MSHTPGPWIAKRPEKLLWAGPTGQFVVIGISGGHEFLICQNDHPDVRGADMVESQANARLIAAAPDLLAACEAALERLRLMGPVSCEKEIAIVEAAIAKAKGT